MTDEALGEFELIARLSARLRGDLPPGAVGIGDDCAALPISGGFQLITCDIAVAGRHFLPERADMTAVGWRLATANVSDICACGGLPGFALVSLMVPPGQSPQALEALYDGLAEAEAAYGFRVIGGNVSGAPALAVDFFLLGETPRFIPRGGARPGDLVALSGPVGDSAAGLETFLADQGHLPGAEELIRRHLRPRARQDLVPLLRRVATAAIDISDGLSSELHHLAAASGATLSVRGAELPRSGELEALARALDKDPMEWMLGGGEEYQIVFTLPAEQREALRGSGARVIGEVLPPAADGGRVLLDGAPLAPGGWNHLRPRP